MFNSIKRISAKEKTVMVFGVVATICTFYIINFYFTGQGMIFWALIETGIMWIIIISLHLLSDNQRILNDELKKIVQDQLDESKTLKQISKEQLEEIKILKEIANETIVLIKKQKKSK